MTDYPLPASHLKQEYEQQKMLFDDQPAIIQHFLESQARVVADGLLSRAHQVHFTLPDRVTIPLKGADQPAPLTIPETFREQYTAGLMTFLSRGAERDVILHHLRKLEQSPHQGVAAATALLRFTTASHMVHNMLPDGRSVIYQPVDDESIPTMPAADEAPESAITQASDAIVELGQDGGNRGEVQSPFVPAARQFYLPQWVAFDNDGHLLVGSEKEADAHVQSMQNYVQILHRVSSLAPYMVACEEYHRKRYGILGQLINQGRALARYKTTAIIREINERAKKGNLNRGLSISMPYFDDQNLEMKNTNFEIIPGGRIMFVPAFVVRAARNEQAQVDQDTRLNSSTRKHLLAQLKALETAFQA